MLTSATLKDLNISLSIISPDTDASGSCVRLHDTGQVRSSSRQVINIELTGSPCASQALGANDSHIVLSMNLFGAIIILSSKAKLGWPP